MPWHAAAWGEGQSPTQAQAALMYFVRSRSLGMGCRFLLCLYNVLVPVASRSHPKESTDGQYKPQMDAGWLAAGRLAGWQAAS